MSNPTVSFVGGPRVIADTTLAHDDIKREVVREGALWGVLDVYDGGERLFVLYGHIEPSVL